MDIALFLTSFAVVLVATFRSLGLGFLAAIAIGYFHGVIRANILSVFTTFMLDAGVLGLYLGDFAGRSRWPDRVGSGPARLFVLFLIVWPTCLFLIPVNHFLVQCVGLRACIWFLPVILIATRLTTADLAVLTRGFAVLNVMALAAGVYVYLYGVEALYPMNAVTVTIYKSTDVVGSKYHRVPSIFLNSHGYGGTMLYTLPFLIDRLVDSRSKY